jgi:hypothetical protein
MSFSPLKVKKTFDFILNVANFAVLFVKGLFFYEKQGVVRDW